MSDSIKLTISRQKSIGPVEVNFNVQDGSGKGNLFQSEYNLARDYLQQIRHQQDAEIRRIEKEGFVGRVAMDSNILAVLASRGGGKSSFLRSLILTENETNEEEKREYYFVREVDPSLFTGDALLSMTLLSAIYAELERRQSSDKCISLNGEIQEVYVLLQKAMRGVNALSNSKSSNEEIGLRDLVLRGNSLQIRSDIYLLVKKFLSLFGGSAKRLVWSIDDFDLAGRRASEHLEDLRVFFNVPNVIILLTADYKGLQDEKISSEYQKLRRSPNPDDVRVDDANRRAKNYLEKLLPRFWRVDLKPFDEKFITRFDSFEFEFVQKNGGISSVSITADEIRSVGAWHVFGIYFPRHLKSFDPLEAKNLREFVHRLLHIGELALSDESQEKNQRNEQNLRRLEFRKTGGLHHHFGEDFFEDARFAGEAYRDLSLRVKAQIGRTVIAEQPLRMCFHSRFKSFSENLPLFRRIWLDKEREEVFDQLLLVNSVDNLFGSQEGVSQLPAINFLDESRVESLYDSHVMTVGGRNKFVSKEGSGADELFWSRAFSSTFWRDTKTTKYKIFVGEQFRLQANKRVAYEMNWVNIIPLFLIGRSGTLDLINLDAPGFFDLNGLNKDVSENLKFAVNELVLWINQVKEKPKVYQFFVETINNPVFFAELIYLLQSRKLSGDIQRYYESKGPDDPYWRDHAALDIAIRLVEGFVPTILDMYKKITPRPDGSDTTSPKWQLGDAPTYAEIEVQLKGHTLLMSKAPSVDDLKGNALCKAAMGVLLPEGAKSKKLDPKDVDNAIKYFAKSVREMRDGRRQLSTVYDYMKKGVGAGIKLYKQDPNIFSGFDAFLSEKGITNRNELAFLKPEETQEFIAVFETILANLREYQSQA